jgi:hypothetical protein
LFDRNDYLLVKTEKEEDNEDDDNTDEKIDPELLQQAPNFDIGRVPTPSSRRFSRNQHTIRSMYLTHLTGRQPIVNAFRVYPNLDLRNLSGNMPFSSSIRNNYYLANVQGTRASNLLLPAWAMLPINTLPDPGSLRHAIPGVLREATNMMNMGVSVEQIIETHPNIVALFDEDVFKNSGILSKWAVGMVHSVYLKGKHIPLQG